MWCVNLGQFIHYWLQACNESLKLLVFPSHWPSSLSPSPQKLHSSRIQIPSTRLKYYNTGTRCTVELFWLCCSLREGSITRWTRRNGADVCCGVWPMRWTGTQPGRSRQIKGSCSWHLCKQAWCGKLIRLQRKKRVTYRPLKTQSTKRVFFQNYSGVHLQYFGSRQCNLFELRLQLESVHSVSHRRSSRPESQSERRK